MKKKKKLKLNKIIKRRKKLNKKFKKLNKKFKGKNKMKRKKLKKKLNYLHNQGFQTGASFRKYLINKKKIIQLIFIKQLKKNKKKISIL